ncbi:MAG TPA: hypothetical protein PLW95_06670 [bacterium]|nr:hypothetical protein [bacterium]
MDKILFKNYGGSYQIVIEKGEDLLNVLKLDEGLWAATSVPIEILNCDKKFLEYLDIDNNKRIRTDEVRNAISYILSLIKNPSIVDGNDTLLLSDINDQTETGKLLIKTAEIILTNSGIEEKEKINLSQVRNSQEIMAKSILNGDGIITPDSSEKEEISSLIKIIIEKIGWKIDVNGEKGIDKEIVDEFFKECSEYLNWYEKGIIPDDKETTDIMIFGKETPYLHNIFTQIEEKIEQYFLLSNFLKFDEKTEELLKLKEDDFKNIDIENRDILIEKLKKLPLAPPNKNLILDFDGIINILYKDKIKNFKENIVNKIFPNSNKLTLENYEKIKKMFSNYKDWIENKKGEKVEQIGIENIKKYIEGNYKEEIEKLIEKDLSVLPFIQSIKDLEKLILYKKYIIEFLNNFVSFSNVYNPDITSLYEAGVLVIDGRKINLNILVKDINAHKKVSSMSNTFIMYLNISGKENNQSQFQIASPLTSGDMGRIRLGKRGIFTDRSGNEWDAEIVDIIKNPVGLLEGIKAPFIKIGENIKNQIEKITETRQKKVEQTLTSPSASSSIRDIMIGGGVAFAALGTCFAYITRVFSQIKFTHILLAIVVICALIFIPSFIITIFRLRGRDLSILFEASECALNVKMRLGTKLGKILTYIPNFPENSEKLKVDVLSGFTKIKSRKRLKVLIFILILLLIFIIFYYKYLLP